MASLLDLKDKLQQIFSGIGQGFSNLGTTVHNDLSGIGNGLGQVGGAIGQDFSNLGSQVQQYRQPMSQPLIRVQTPQINMPQIGQSMANLGAKIGQNLPPLITPSSIAGRYIQGQIKNYQQYPIQKIFNPQQFQDVLTQPSSAFIRPLGQAPVLGQLAGFGPKGELPPLPPNLDFSPALEGASFLAGKAPIVNAALGQMGKIKLGPALGKVANVAEEQIAQNATKDLSHGNIISRPELPSETLGIRPTSNQVNPPQQVSGLRQFWDRARNIIASQGQAGQELARRLQASRNQAETTAGNWVSQLPTVRSLSPKEFDNFVSVAEGQAKPTSTKISQAANEWNNVRNQIYSTAQQSGIDVGKLENYFPHHYDPNMFKGDNFVKAVNHLVETGQAQTTDEAAQLLRHAQDIVRNRRQGNLEFQRLVDLPGYQRTKDALFNYIDSASNRIAQVKNFGPDDSLAMQLINRIGQEGKDAATVKNLYDISVGAKQYGSTQKAVSAGLRKFNTVTKLGLGAITNAGQSVNTATVTGGIRTLLNTPKAAFSPEAKDFALKAGVTLDSVIQDLREGSGLTGKLSGKIGAPGFNIVEKFNRTLAAIAGRDYARSLAAKGDAQTLAKMGIKLVGNKLTPEQEIQAARNIVERTQFKVDPQDLPGWTSSPWGKVLSQFKTFSYNQSAFLGREIIQPALKGNVLPLIRFIGIGVPVGMGIQTIKNVIRNRKDETNPIKRVQQGFGQVGGLGLAGDIVTGLAPMNGQYLDANRATTLALGTLGGPTVGNAIDLYGSLSQAVQGKPANLERSVLRDIPLAGPTIQNTILPYKSANGDTNRRFGNPSASDVALKDSIVPTNSIVPMVSASSSQPTELTPVQKAKIKSQISDIDKKEKSILGNNGTTLPIFGQIGGLQDSQKNSQILQLEAQKQQLQDQLVTPKEKAAKEKAYTEANYSLKSQELQSANDYQGWTDLTNTYLDYLKQYKDSLDPVKDKTEILKIQNSIEDTQAKLNKYASYGGFKKGKKPRKISIKFSSPKSAKLTIRKSTRSKIPTIKLAKAPTFKLTKPKKATIRLAPLKVPAIKAQSFKNTLTG